MKSVYFGALLALAGSAIAHDDDEEQQAVVIEKVPAPGSWAANDGVTPDEPNPLKDFVCEDNYEISVYSRSPLVIYIKNFVSPFEREHLMKISNGTFARSNVASADGDHVSDQRTSSSTTIGADEVTLCIQNRAARFQGLDKPVGHLEPIQLVSYNVGEQYQHHTDWFPETSTNMGNHAGVDRGGNRVSSFFTYIDVSDDLVGGGTQFPKVAAKGGEGWCQFVECDEEWNMGVTFRAVEGNAVYWENLIDAPNGRKQGDDRTLHSGLPVIRGSKLGMNIWTKEGDYA